MAKRGGKKSVIAMLAVMAAIAGAAVAIGVYLKKKAQTIGEQLDYDGSLYYEDDDYLDDDSDGNVPEEAEKGESPEEPTEEGLPEDEEK